MSSPGNPIS
jgi:hypothetical protein